MNRYCCILCLTVIFFLVYYCFIKKDKKEEKAAAEAEAESTEYYQQIVNQQEELKQNIANTNMQLEHARDLVINSTPHNYDQLEKNFVNVENNLNNLIERYQENESSCGSYGRKKNSGRRERYQEHGDCNGGSHSVAQSASQKKKLQEEYRRRRNHNNMGERYQENKKHHKKHDNEHTYMPY